jgi:MFS family permease
MYGDEYNPQLPKRVSGADYLSLSSADVEMEETSTTAYNPGSSAQHRMLPPGHDNVASNSDDSGFDEEMPLMQALKRYPKIARYTLAMTLPIIGWGYDLIIVGAIVGVDSFVAEYGTLHEGEMIIPNIWLTLWLALPPAGSALGALTGGQLMDIVGRRYSLMIGSVASALAIALIFFSHMLPTQMAMRGMITAGLTFQGFTVGIIKTTCMTYVSETSPSAIRGSAMAIFPTFTLVGQLIGALVTYLVNSNDSKTAYLAAFASQWVLCLAPFTLAWVMPESPTHLLRKGARLQAFRSARRLYAPNVTPEAALNRLQITIDEEAALEASTSYIACFKPAHLRRTLIVFFAQSLPACFGLDLLSNANVYLKAMGMESSTALLIMMGGIVAGMAGNGGGIWMLSRFGRRTLCMTTLAGASLLWAAHSISGFWAGEIQRYFAAGTAIAIIVVCGLGVWPASYAISGEASTLQMRAKTTALGSIAGQVSVPLCECMWHVGAATDNFAGYRNHHDRHSAVSVQSGRRQPGRQDRLRLCWA